MPEGPEREKLCRQAAELAARSAVWIFEGYPVSYQLLNPWLENFLPHDFEFTRLKYLSVDPALRDRQRSQFKVLNFSDLR